MKVLRPFSGTGAICFPIGKPPVGTCQYASTKCLKSCCARSDIDYDEELHLPHEEKQEIYNIVITTQLDLLVDIFMRELDGLQTNILYWFGSGDCQDKDLDRVHEIIELIDYPIEQMGFTRNEKLWELHKDIFALTLESEVEIAGRYGLFAIPDYKSKTTNLRLRQKSYTSGWGCGGVYVTDAVNKKFKHYANCRTCYRIKYGCFDLSRR